MDILADVAALDSDEEGTTKPTTVRKTGGKRGPCYTPKEDRIICESFMAASENPIVGTSQKGRTFREEILKYYNKKMESYNSGGKPKPVRTAESVHSRFLTISRLVSKYIAITKTHRQRRESGINTVDHYNYCLEVFQQQLGLNFNDYYLSYLYLNKCPKWFDFDEQDKNDQEGRMNRPIGKKAAMKKKKQEELVVSTVLPITPVENISYPNISTDKKSNDSSRRISLIIACKHYSASSVVYVMSSIIIYFLFIST
jgi:hypothetical protein